MAKLAQYQECDKLHITLSEKKFGKLVKNVYFYLKSKKKNMKKFDVDVKVVSYC